jgi:hypothetical protein
MRGEHIPQEVAPSLLTEDEWRRIGIGLGVPHWKDGGPR